MPALTEHILNHWVFHEVGWSVLAEWKAADAGHKSDCTRKHSTTASAGWSTRGSVSMHRCGPETLRLIHRAFEPNDAAVFYRLNSHPEVMRYTCEDRVTSEAAARQAILDYPDFREHGFGRWACVLKSTEQIIGFCGLKYLPEFDSVDVGYRFFPEYWGQGIATEACLASVAFGFLELDLPLILGFVKAENRASRRVLEKAGFRDCGLTSVGDVCAHRFECHRQPLSDSHE